MKNRQLVIKYKQPIGILTSTLNSKRALDKHFWYNGCYPITEAYMLQGDNKIKVYFKRINHK